MPNENNDIIQPTRFGAIDKTSGTPSGFPDFAFEHDNPDTDSTPTLTLINPWKFDIASGFPNTVPIGAVMPFSTGTAPAGYLNCDGTAISRTTFSDLFDVIGTAYGVGDGSTTYNVPDYRGLFLRGTGAHGTLNMANGSDVAGGSVGDENVDQMFGHHHAGGATSLFRSFGATGGSQTPPGGSGGTPTPGGNTEGAIDDGATGTPNNGVETYPSHGVTNWIIRATNASVTLENVSSDTIADLINTNSAIFHNGIIMPKTSGKGIKVDRISPTFGFADLLGDQFSKNTGGTRPTLTTYNGVINGWLFGVGDEAYITYHIPHDYVPGTDIFLHIHWSHTSASVTSGGVTFKATSIYAKAHNQAAFGSPAVGTFPGTASTTQYQQILTEVQYSDSTPSGLQVDTDLLEPDGVIEMTFEVDANNISASTDIFVHYVDIHYQTTGLIGTKDKVPNFYT